MNISIGLFFQVRHQRELYALENISFVFKHEKTYSIIYPRMVLNKPVKPFQEQLLNGSTRGVNSVNIFDILKFLEFGRNRD